MVGGDWTLTGFRMLTRYSAGRIWHHRRCPLWVRCEVSCNVTQHNETITDSKSSSMSAWIGVDTYKDYFNSPNSDLQGGVCDFNLSKCLVD